MTTQEGRSHHDIESFAPVERINTELLAIISDQVDTFIPAAALSVPAGETGPATKLSIRKTENSLYVQQRLLR